MNIASVLEAIATYNVRHVLITGGEPLIQRQTPALVDALLKNHYLVSIETHGEIPIESVAGKARIVMDIKTPSSGMSREGFVRNLPLLRDGDEVKFVIASKQDYAWAKTLILSGQIPKNCLILLSPAIPAEMSPGNIQPVEIQWLANQLLEDRLPARLQIQLHKYIWGANRRGV